MTILQSRVLSLQPPIFASHHTSQHAPWSETFPDLPNPQAVWTLYPCITAAICIVMPLRCSLLNPNTRKLERWVPSISVLASLSSSWMPGLIPLIVAMARFCNPKQRQRRTAHNCSLVLGTLTHINWFIFLRWHCFLSLRLLATDSVFMCDRLLALFESLFCLTSSLVIYRPLKRDLYTWGWCIKSTNPFG